ncbi:hypothetical protein KAJ83_16675 [Marivibrio halodurans]|uniref:OmpA family protein n=1 Tax=Marivibrio halodurans TaxID=2039722 RepID=A0A8J7V3U0_9PROT|nr:hypothetical protein [Marivibrio halodurans]MBP5858656.1 hypothetical protein [Marivibrio halodurans]
MASFFAGQTGHAGRTGLVPKGGCRDYRVSPLGGRLATSTRAVAFALVGLGLAACGETWPSLEASNPAGSGAATQPVQVGGSSDSSTSGSARSTSSSAPQPVSVGQSQSTSIESASATRETFVGNKVTQMEGDLNKLAGNVEGLAGRKQQLVQETSSGADTYHELVAQITSRLQRGTTPGNPVLVDYWNRAQVELEQVAEKVPAMTKLSNDAADEAAFGQYLLNAVQATYGLSGAVDEDHIRLQHLEDSVHQELVEIDRLLTDLSQDINRQTTYVNNERQNMTTLSLAIKNGDLYGTSLATRSFQQTENLARQAARQAQPQPGERPLVIIKFDRPNVNYQSALYTAVGRALERKPNATFDLVAVSPSSGSAAQEALNSSAAKRNAEGVLRTLTDMGVPASRVQLLQETAEEADNNEVHIFVR